MSLTFLLSPASLRGERARILLRPEASFDLALRVRRGGAPIGEVFSFLSGLYFRGKLAYARRFGASTYVITAGRGLVDCDHIVDARALAKLGACDIDEDDARYRRPLLRDARKLARGMVETDQVVLLGSVATGKYLSVLGGVFGERLLFPPDFVGRGDMSRGGLLLRKVRAGEPLAYAPVLGAVRHGKRPPKLAPHGGAPWWRREDLKR